MYSSKVLLGAVLICPAFAWERHLPLEPEALDFNGSIFPQHHPLLKSHEKGGNSASDAMGVVEEEENPTRSSTGIRQTLQNLGFDHLIDQQHLIFQPLTPQQATKLKKTLAENEQKVGRLGIQAVKLREAFQDLQATWPALHKEYTDEHTNQKLLNARIMIHELDKKVGELITLKLLELGTFCFQNHKYSSRYSKNQTYKHITQLLNTLAPELFDSIRAPGLGGYVDSLVNSVKQIMVHHDDLAYPYPENRAGNMRARREFEWLFQIIEFLFTNHFISRKDLHQLFKHNQVLRLSAVDFFRASQDGLSAPFLRELAPSFITDQFVWRVEFHFLAALSKAVKKRMDFELLVWNLHVKARKSAQKYPQCSATAELARFMDSFDRQTYAHHIVNSVRTMKPMVDGVRFRQNMQQDVDHLVHIFFLIMTRPSAKKVRKMAPLVSELLAFIDEHIWPGVLRAAFQKLGNMSASSKYLALQFELVLVPARLDYCMAMALELDAFLHNLKTQGSIINRGLARTMVADCRDRGLALYAQTRKTYETMAWRFQGLSGWLKRHPRAGMMNNELFALWIHGISAMIDEWID
ncbi:hypothetical protein PtB15_4B635 [Puccinia triticina]|nr:hypothetical protein PtB15_4B635 [Puccinia triticina]